MILFMVTLALGLLTVSYMMKVANENNVEWHQLELVGSIKEKRIFFISDTHARKINKNMIQLLNGPFDAVIIGGDFVDERTKESVMHENLALLTELGPTYFVWGNNDREVGEEKLLKIFSQYGVTVLENDAVILDDANDKLWLTAINDTSTMKYSYEAAFAKIGEGEHTIFVSHNPAVFAAVRKKYHVDLMLGGHLHGGQIRMGRFAMHPNGSYSERQGCMTLISNGYGTTLVPMRLGAKPQCHVIDIIFTP